MRMLEKLQNFLAPIRLPNPYLMMKVEGCDGVANAYFEKDTIKVCYEYFEYLMKKSPKMVRQGLTPNDALIGPTVEVFLHELGHGLVRMLDVPYFGKEEDITDYIATYLLLTFCKDDARRLILGASFIGDAEAMEEQGKAPELRTIAELAFAARAALLQSMVHGLWRGPGIVRRRDRYRHAAAEPGEVVQIRVAIERICVPAAHRALYRPADEATGQSRGTGSCSKSPVGATMNAPRPLATRPAPPLGSKMDNPQEKGKRAKDDEKAAN